MEKEKINDLYQKYLNRTLDILEQKQWADLLANEQAAPAIKESMDIDYQGLNDADLLNLPGSRRQEILAGILMHPRSVTKTLWIRFAVAAAAIILVIAAGLFYDNQHIGNGSANYANDIAPGTAGATLQLANGTQIKLSEVTNGEVAKETGVSVTKTKDGQLVYEMKGTNGDPNQTNTLTTAKGGTYVLILPDQSKVWMNAASSLTYSIALVSNGERRVKLEGEAYFEVSKDKTHPFVVSSRGQQVEVLGTHFNINNYAANGVTKTTLLEGKVKVTSQAFQGSAVLAPGQQAIVTNQKLQLKPNVDLEEVVAWKNGYFSFNNENIKTVMNTLALWYDIEVVYEGTPSNEGFNGKISRTNGIAQVLRMLEGTKGIRFNIEGRRVTVIQ